MDPTPIKSFNPANAHVLLVVALIMLVVVAVVVVIVVNDFSTPQTACCRPCVCAVCVCFTYLYSLLFSLSVTSHSSVLGWNGSAGGVGEWGGDGCALRAMRAQLVLGIFHSP